jgi:cytoskeletal protein RodZ
MPEHLLSWLVVLACLPGCVLAAYLALRDVVASRALFPLTLVLAPVLLGVAFVGALALAAALDTPRKGTSSETPPVARPYVERTNPIASEETFVAGKTTVEEATSEETTSPEPTGPLTIPERTITDATAPATTGPTASPRVSPSSSAPAYSSPLPPASSSPSAETRTPR